MSTPIRLVPTVQSESEVDRERLAAHLRAAGIEGEVRFDDGARALYSQRLIEGKPAAYDSPVKVPGDAYEPRCAEHFVLPGRPH